MTNLPTLGAAIPYEHLEDHLDWLVEDKRDLELQGFWNADLLDGDWLPQAKRIAAMLQPHAGRRGIHGPFWGFTLASEDPAIRAVVTRRLDQGLDVCAEVAATQMVIHSPIKSWDMENQLNDRDRPERFRGYFRATLEKAVAKAERLGVEMVLENIEDREPYARNELVGLFDSPALKVSIDTGHAHYAHVINRAPAVDRYVRAAGNLLAHVHLQDADGYADRHWALGEGTVPWRAVFEELSHLTSNPRLIIELRDRTKCRASARYMEELGIAR